MRREASATKNGAPLPIRRAPPPAPPGAAPGRRAAWHDDQPAPAVHRTCSRRRAPCGPDRLRHGRLQPAPERPEREGARRGVRQMARTHPAAFQQPTWCRLADPFSPSTSRVPSGLPQRAAQGIGPTSPIMTESAPLVIRSRACPVDFTHLDSIRFTVPNLHRA
jgi:hypothetical protein